MTKTTAERRHHISRRTFVAATGTVAAGATLLPMGHAAASLGSNFDSGRKAKMSDFQAVEGSRFTVHGSNRHATLELLATRALPHPGALGECFELRFRKVNGQALSQNTYHFAHPDVGAMQLFVVPGARTGSSTYTAVINRTKPTDL